MKNNMIIQENKIYKQRVEDTNALIRNFLMNMSFSTSDNGNAVLKFNSNSSRTIENILNTGYILKPDVFMKRNDIVIKSGLHLGDEMEISVEQQIIESANEVTAREQIIGAIGTLTALIDFPGDISYLSERRVKDFRLLDEEEAKTYVAFRVEDNVYSQKVTEFSQVKEFLYDNFKLVK